MNIKSIKEADIRDYIAANLHLVETGLTLLKTELHLKNEKEADGFLDIFAKDRHGKL